MTPEEGGDEDLAEGEGHEVVEASEPSTEPEKAESGPEYFQIHYLGPENARLEVPVSLDLGKKLGYKFMAL